MTAASVADEADDLKLLVEWIYSRDVFARLGPYAEVTDQLLQWAAHSDPSRPEVTQLMYSIWKRRQDLQQAFDIGSAEGRASLREWFRSTGTVEHDITPLLAGKGNWLDRVKAAVQPQKKSSAAGLSTAGMNVLGSFAGEFGIGQHARFVVEALDAADVTTQLMNVKLGPHAVSTSGYEDRYVSECRYLFNLLCLNVMSGPDVVRQIGVQNFLPQYNICYGYWELERCPDQWQPYLKLYDEFWAPTKFIAGALKEAVSVPVIHMPVAFTVPAVPLLSRQELNLPAEKFLFLFHFDGFSFAQRKNPEAAVVAFKRAFPAGSENVALIIKTKNAPEVVLKLEEMIDGDKRCMVISEHYSRQQVLSLENCCDAYVSLHRSEGLGMGPAEMMLLGKPVIVTNYSGNLDFTHEDNACLVDYKLVDVEPGQYAYSEAGQRWAEPDIDHAAHYMAKLVQEADFARDLGQRARTYIAEHHNPAAIGARYRARLNELRS